MATPEQMEKKRTRQIGEILAAVQELAVQGSAPDPPDRTGEILTAVTAVGSAFGEMSERLDRTLHACGMMASEIIELKAEIAGLKEQMTLGLPPPASTRRTKK